MVRKIFYLLFPIIFLLVSFSFFSQKIFAQTCSSLGGSCGSPTSSSCQAGTTMVSGATDCLGGVCCKTSTGGSTTSSIPIGKTGCSYKNDSSQTVLIGCQSNGICIGGNYNSSTDSYENGYCQANGCPVCDQGYEYDRIQNDCQNASGAHDHKPLTSSQSCTSNQTCVPGCGCDINNCAGQAWPSPPPLAICSQGVCQTALGNIPTSAQGLLTTVFSIALSIAGVIALGLIIASGYRLMISQGNPEQVKGAREQLTAAIIGLLFIIFSLVILQIIGVNILKIPGFSAN
jgi:hypothetical protein